MARRTKPNRVFTPNMVPDWEYVRVEYVPVAAIRKYHTAAQYRNFCKWISGQTCPEGGVYPWDYSRWVKAGMPRAQGQDWD